MSARDDLLDVIGFSDALNQGKEPEQLVDAYRAEVLTEAAEAPLYIWQVWGEDQPVHAYYATEDDARQGSIDYWEEEEPEEVHGPYSWDPTLPCGELQVAGQPTGIFFNRQPVYGRSNATARATVLTEAAAHLARQADELWAPGRTAHTVMHADADELRRLAAEAQPATTTAPAGGDARS